MSEKQKYEPTTEDVLTANLFDTIAKNSKSNRMRSALIASLIILSTLGFDALSSISNNYFDNEATIMLLVGAVCLYLAFRIAKDSHETRGIGVTLMNRVFKQRAEHVALQRRGVELLDQVIEQKKTIVFLSNTRSKN